MATPVHTIDKLPEVERRKILNSILAGETLASVAAKLGITRQAMSSWHKRVVKPAISVAQSTQVRAIANNQSPIPGNDLALDVAKQQVLTREIVQASPVRERLEFLWDTTQSGVKAARDAVRVTYDEMGNEVSIAQDLSALAPLLNQGHKSIEILGKLTGELRDTTGPSLTLNIVCPAGEDKQRVDFSDPDAIEMGFE